MNLEHSTPTEVIRDLLRPFVEDLDRVREELGAERVPREQAERERDELRTRLEALQESPQTPETTAEEPERGEFTPDRGEGSQEASEHRSWWRRWFGLD